MVGIVALQHLEHIQPLCSKSGGGLSVHIAAGCIGGTIGAIAAYGEHRCIQPGNAGGSGKSQLLIPSAQTLTGQVDHRFTACKKGKFPALPCMAFQDACQKAACLPCLAAELVREHDRLIAQSAALLCSGSAQLPDAAGDAGGDVVQRLGGLLLQQCSCLRGKLQLIFFCDRQGIGTGAAVRAGGTAGDHIQRVS